MADPGEPAFAEALNRLWVKFLPQLEKRVAILEAAAASLAGGALTPSQHQEASAEAHKLAGVLGTFGLNEGTLLAREAETAYAGDAGPTRAARLTEIAAQLRAILSSRN
jgi:HPt (histidine-containing phosphotransfer) domain-containing protein